jgi:predicted HTH transcriptional regulator
MRPYSLRAVHEAIVNAVVHRDYQLGGSNVRVFIFADRIEISNPGGLHNTLRRENLFAGCQPFRRNQLLCGFLRDFVSPITERALMESRGEGFLMMVRETRRLGGEIDLIAHPDAVTVSLMAAWTDR